MSSTDELSGPQLHSQVDSPPRVSIIIPAGARIDYLRACLSSLERHAPRSIPFEIIVVVNRAQRDLELPSTDLPVNFIRSEVNLGLAGAGTRGRSAARGELLLILHDDAEIEPGWMEALVETADARPDAGAVGGTVLNFDGSLQNAGMILLRNATTTRPWNAAAPLPETLDRTRAVDYCGTSSLLIRASTWDAIGGMDESFYPVYYVDVDLAMAIRAHGQVVLFEPRSRIRHHAGGGSDIRFRYFITARNRRIFQAKWRDALLDYAERAGSAEEIEAAIARAEAFAGPAPQPSIPRTINALPDSALDNESYAQLELLVQREFIVELGNEIASARGELARLQGDAAFIERIERDALPEPPLSPSAPLTVAQPESPSGVPSRFRRLQVAISRLLESWRS